MLTFSQIFCLEDKCSFPLSSATSNCQILLTSLFPEECDCILFLHPPGELLQLANVSNSPRLPARVPGRRGNSGGSICCRERFLAAWQRLWLAVASRWQPGYLVLDVREVGLVLSTPCCIRDGELGLGFCSGGFSSGRHGLRGLHVGRGRLAMPACRPRCPPVIRFGSQPRREDVPFPIPSVCYCPCECKRVQRHPASEGVSSGEPLALSCWQPPWAGDCPDKIVCICRAMLCLRRGSTRPTPTLPHLLLLGAALAKLLPALLPQNSLFCCPDSLGLKGKTSTFKKSLFVFLVTSMVTERGSQLWHNTWLMVFLVIGSRETWLLAIVLGIAGGLGAY